MTEVDKIRIRRMRENAEVLISVTLLEHKDIRFVVDDAERYQLKQKLFRSIIHDADDCLKEDG